MVHIEGTLSFLPPSWNTPNEPLKSIFPPQLDIPNGTLNLQGIPTSYKVPSNTLDTFRTASFFFFIAARPVGRGRRGRCGGGIGRRGRRRCRGRRSPHGPSPGTWGDGRGMGGNGSVGGEEGEIYRGVGRGIRIGRIGGG